MAHAQKPHFVFRAKRTSPFKSARWGRQFSRLLAAEVCAISGSNAGYTVFRGSVKGTGYPLHSPVSLSLPLPNVTVCHHISTGVYNRWYVYQPLCKTAFCRFPWATAHPSSPRTVDWAFTGTLDFGYANLVL